MHRTILGLAAACSFACAANAQELVDGSEIDAIVAIAAAHGEASLETGVGGDPRIVGKVGGIGYRVFFMNCTDGRDCEDINFYAGFGGVKPTLDAINDWNRDKRFGNAYLDSDLDAVIEYDVNLEYGVSRANLDAAFGLWELLEQQFAAHVGYTPAP